jgi:replicative DNA helicase
VAEYRRYVTELSGRSGFIVCTQKDFGGKKPTAEQLKQMMIDTGADLLGVDQLSLMMDAKGGKDKRERFTNISEDLFLVSEALQKPIIAVGQASREAVKARKKTEDTPELHEISESDGVGQNATRAISLRVVNKVLRLSVKKNRYGKNNFDVLLLWDIDLGILTPLLLNSGENTAEEYGF